MPRLLEPGKFYFNSKGKRYLYVCGVLNTYRWGPVMLCEESDSTGAAPSIVEARTMPPLTDDWIEVGKKEFLQQYNFVACDGCGLFIEQGQNYIEADEGVYHQSPEQPCYANYIARGAPTDNVIKPTQDDIAIVKKGS